MHDSVSCDFDAIHVAIFLEILHAQYAPDVSSKKYVTHANMHFVFPRNIYFNKYVYIAIFKLNDLGQSVGCPGNNIFKWQSGNT